MLRESRERSIKPQSSQNSLTHWVPDAALIDRMARKGMGLLLRMVARWWVRFAVWMRDGDGCDGEEAGCQIVENVKKYKKRSHTIL